MKLIAKITLFLLLLYALFWSGVAAYFTYADGYKESVESHLGSMLGQTVQIEELETSWQGFSPSLKVTNFKVYEDSPSEPSIAFESLSATVDPVSALRLWPNFTEFTINQPSLEVVSLDDKRLSVGGIVIGAKQSEAKVSQRLISWLLDQRNGRWVDGTIIWMPEDGQINRYKDINIDFVRQLQQRELTVSLSTSKGPLAFCLRTDGDLSNDAQWGASLEIAGEQGEQLLTPEDFSVEVQNGNGKLLLKELDIERIRDFIKLTGLASEAAWLLDAKLMGRLHDVHLDFSGPLLNIKTWSLIASASNVGFESIGSAPAMNKLSGELKATKNEGNFVFSTQDSEFSWPRWYKKSFPVSHALGDVSWSITDNGSVNFIVKNAEFEDENARISDVYASIQFNAQVQTVSSFGDLFKLDSVAELDYSDEGELIVSSDGDGSEAPIEVDARAKFTVLNLSELSGYLPNSVKLRKFRSWSSKAFPSGEITDGVVSYKGEVSADAFTQGKAALKAKANFANVSVDYAPKQGWPAAKRGLGVLTIDNELLTITPSEIWLNEDPLTEALVQIDKLFQRDRVLTVRGKTTTSLIKGMNFMFKGPLIKPENRNVDLPIIPESGWIDIDTHVEMALNDVANVKVNGVAQIRDGHGLLPQNVPVNDINASIKFTERSAESSDLSAVFLGGETQGQLVTVEESKPPVLKVVASGAAKVDALQPWIGEHLLTCLTGIAPWQGSILFERGRVEVEGESNLLGIDIDAPAPLLKKPQQAAKLMLSMVLGGGDVPHSLSLNYNDQMSARFQADSAQGEAQKTASLFDNALISLGGDLAAKLKPGVNFSINGDHVNLDDWLSIIIELASFQPVNASDNTDFLDAMRSVEINSKNPTLLGREFGQLAVSAVSVDGLHWIGTLDGDNLAGTMQMQPRAQVSSYGFNLSKLTISKDPNPGTTPDLIDYSLVPRNFPKIDLNVDAFRLANKNLGSLSLSAKPEDEAWLIDDFNLIHNGITTTATGGWLNNPEVGSITNIEFNTVIDEAEGAFNELDFDGIIKKGDGTVAGNFRWIGAPHEFDYARLNGDFDAFIKDGELVKIEPGGGKLVGLLNFNAIARRLVFDFRDVFASGLKFDRMRYAGTFVDGEAILSEAFVLSPAAFIQLEGKVDLNKELVDLEVHVSPELGGNLALLSALANPAAGAFVFITQRIFKDEMRNANFKSYQARGTWEGFEMVDLNSEAAELASAQFDADASLPSEVKNADINDPEPASSPEFAD